MCKTIVNDYNQFIQQPCVYGLRTMYRYSSSFTIKRFKVERHNGTFSLSRFAVRLKSLIAAIVFMVENYLTVKMNCVHRGLVVGLY